MEQLRSLDQKSTRTATMAAIALATIGALVLGLGMCCTMVWTEYFVLGIIVGLVGIAGVGSAYPAYKLLAKKERAKLAPQIMVLSEELMHCEHLQKRGGMDYPPAS